MKRFLQFILVPVIIGMLAGCEKADTPNGNKTDQTPTLKLMNSAVTFEAAGGDISVSFKANQAWSASSDQAWLTVTPASGSGSTTDQSLTLKAGANAETERTAKVTLTMGSLTAELGVTQKKNPDYVPQMSISDFKKKTADKVNWYKLSGEIAAIENEDYGNFFIFDATGYVYVYGLCEKQVESNDQSFSKLGLKVGDTVTMMTLRSEYNETIEAGGTIPAYFVSKQAGEYKLGKKAASTTAGWLELPKTSSTDGQDLLMHYFPDGKRSYSAYWDYDHLVSSWVAYPLCAGNIGSGTRTDKFCMNPLLPRNKQPYIPKAFGGGAYDRGHQIPSADRLDWRVNFETFFATNITPQSTGLNANDWALLEGKVRTWARNSDTDTLYVVTGCSVAGSTATVDDGDGKKITVPSGYYKALLRLTKDKSYSAIGFWFDNADSNKGSIQKSMAMSIDDLEKKVGVDFFVNLNADTQATVEAEDPATNTWWWNN